MDWLTDAISAVDAGSWAEWFGAVGAVAAFLLAAVAYRQSVQDQARTEARRVYVVPRQDAQKIEVGGGFQDPTLTDLYFNGDGLERGTDSRNNLMWIATSPGALHRLTIHNDSTEVMTFLQVDMLGVTGSLKYQSHGLMIRHLAPGVEYDLNIYVHKSGGRPFKYEGAVPAVKFTDAAGRRWRKHLWAPLERIGPTDPGPRISRWRRARRSRRIARRLLKDQRAASRRD